MRRVKKFDDAALEVVDIPDRELFAVGTHKGRSYTVDDIDQLITDTAKLSHLRHPVKLDHDETQEIVVNSGLPAIGWVENLRRIGDKLVGDFRNVPKKLASLIEAGAYRQTSAEIYHNFTDAVTQETYPLVYRAQAILGASIPAVKNLDDIIALYAEAFEEPDGEYETFAMLDAPSGTFTSEGSYEELRDRLREKIGGEETYVSATFPTYVVVVKYGQNGEPTRHYMIPYTVAGTDISLGSWTEVDEKTVYVPKFSEDQVDTELRFWQHLKAGPGEQDAGSSASSQEREEFMERAELIAALGLAEDASDELILSTVQQHKAAVEAPPAIEVDGKVFSEADVQYFADTRSPEYKQLTEDAKAGRQVQLERFAEKRDALIGQFVTDGKIAAADMPTWQGLYDKDPEGTAKALEGLQTVRVDLSEHGRSTPKSGTPDFSDDEGNEKLANAIAKFQEENPDADFMTAYTAVSKEVK